MKETRVDNKLHRTLKFFLSYVYATTLSLAIIFSRGNTRQKSNVDKSKYLKGEPPIFLKETEYDNINNNV